MDLPGFRNRFEYINNRVREVRSRLNNVLREPGLFRAGIRQRITLRFIPRVFHSVRSLAPWAVNILPTFQCCFQCRYCSNHQMEEAIRTNRMPREWAVPMKPETWQRILAQARPYRPILNIVGGEPLLYEHIEALLLQCHRDGFYFSFTTNGTRLPGMATFLVEIRIPLIGISFDGPRDVVQRIAGNSQAYDIAVKGVESLRKARHDAGSRSPRIKLILTICSENHTRLVESFREMVSMKPDQISLRHYLYTSEEDLQGASRFLIDREVGVPFPFGGEDARGLNDAIDGAVVAEQLRECAGIARRHRIHLVLEPGFTYADIVRYYSSESPWIFPKRSCWEPWNIMNFLPNGDSVFCGIYFYYVYGNIHARDLDVLWNDISIRRLRKYLLENSPFPFCRRCYAMLF